MRNNVIVVNCSNVKAAQERIQTTGRMRYLQPEAVFSLELLPVLELLEVDGLFRRSRLAKSLNERGIATSSGKRWGPVTVNRLMAVLADVIRTSAWT